MPRIASVIVLAAAATLTATANARDFITRISDTAWNVNGRMVQGLGNMVIWNDGNALFTPSGVYGRNFDTIPGVIPGNPYGMFGESGFGDPGFGDCSCTPSWNRRLPSLNSISPNPLRPYRPSCVPSTRGGLGRW
jgi:hypothetical protein